MVEVKVGSQTLSWSFFLNPTSKVVFGFLTQGGELIQDEAVD